MQTDVLVIGGGHAGIEASAISAKLGAATLLVTANVDHIGQMSCNPSIGGPGKSHLVHELDMLGGLMGRLIDQTVIHQRLLNTSRGPAVQALRAQADMRAYAATARHTLEKTPHLTLLQDEITRLEPQKNGFWLAQTQTNQQIAAKKVVITTGTFLKGEIFIGKSFHKPAGRYGDDPSVPLCQSLNHLGIATRRLKTGTVPRLSGKTIRTEKTEPLESTDDHFTFSFFTQPRIKQRRVPCFLTHTTPATKEIVTGAMEESALFGGKITGTGPRYCPSIEDKYFRFKDKSIHPVFLEPEGQGTDLYYVQGLSTSLPAHIQHQMIRSIVGLEDAVIVKYGYAVEYDAIDARALALTLEHAGHPGLYFAGQVNGTTGYEEAAGQGLLAGANAALAVLEQEPLVLTRQQAYLGVMVDDLITLEVAEPYRMFSSRCEHRLTLRPDNCPDRLGTLATEKGLLNFQESAALLHHLEEKSSAAAALASPPSQEDLQKPWPKPIYSALCDAFYSGYISIADRKRSRAEAARPKGTIDNKLIDKLTGRC